jgi:hypothetical protein
MRVTSVLKRSDEAKFGDMIVERMHHLAPFPASARACMGQINLFLLWIRSDVLRVITHTHIHIYIYIRARGHPTSATPGKRSRTNIATSWSNGTYCMRPRQQRSFSVSSVAHMAGGHLDVAKLLLHEDPRVSFATIQYWLVAVRLDWLACRLPPTCMHGHIETVQFLRSLLRDVLITLVLNRRID